MKQTRTNCFRQRDELHAALLTAHAHDDWTAMAGLYGAAAHLSEAAGDIDAACFFLTQAYVFALDADVETADTLHRRLVALGRDE